MAAMWTEGTGEAGECNGKDGTEGGSGAGKWDGGVCPQGWGQEKHQSKQSKDRESRGVPYPVPEPQRPGLSGDGASGVPGQEGGAAPVWG